MGIHRNTTPSTKSSADKASEVQLMKVIKLVQVDYFGKLLNFVKTDAEKKENKATGQFAVQRQYPSFVKPKGTIQKENKKERKYRL